MRDVAVQPSFSSLQFGVNSTTRHYSMVAFQVGFVSPVNSSGTFQVSIMTNLNPGGTILGSYAAPSTNSSLAFAGFTTTTPGEYITGFLINGGFNPNGGGVGATAFELGQLASPVPEPGSLALVSAGLLLPLIGRHVVRRSRAGAQRGGSPGA